MKNGENLVGLHIAKQGLSSGLDHGYLWRDKPESLEDSAWKECVLYAWGL